MNAIVDVIAKGKRYTAEVNLPKGSPENPVTGQELETKFRHNATFSNLRSDKVDKVIEMLYELEKVDDITELTEWLTVG
jgi:2-methylcitrate dehydratase PrpD